MSSTFDVEVKLWNKKDLTGVGVYAFDFNLTWLNSTYGMECGSIRSPFITLVCVSFTAPWDHYFTVANRTITPFLNATDGKYYTGYNLAITALDNSTPLTDVQIVLVKLTFHIDCEPLYPDKYVTPFDLEVVLSDVPDPDTGKAGPIAGVEVHDGTFTLESFQPDVHLEPRYFCEYKAGMSHTVEFWISNMSKVYGFGFGVTFNNTLLKTDIQSVKFCDAFPTPYEVLTESVVDNGDGTSTIIVQLQRPCEKPTVTHQPGPAATFSLISTFDEWADNYIIPNKDNSTIVLSWAYVLAKCGCAGSGETRQYDYGDVFPADYLLLAYNTTIDYFWRPRIGDLNLDGEVDVQDLQALAALYATDTGPALNTWGNLDGRGNTIVDIFDFVIGAKVFGKPYTCDIADP
ncbi:hypothetical protein MUP79_04145 [Candidatus Bathyarchaeota archaeon]|nr:hypothetical protein [Candidatus Bathyarchaeota archaeon]